MGIGGRTGDDGAIVCSIVYVASVAATIDMAVDGTSRDGDGGIVTCINAAGALNGAAFQAELATEADALARAIVSGGGKGAAIEVDVAGIDLDSIAFSGGGGHVAAVDSKVVNIDGPLIVTSTAGEAASAVALSVDGEVGALDDNMSKIVGGDICIVAEDQVNVAVFGEPEFFVYSDFTRSHVPATGEIITTAIAGQSRVVAAYGGVTAAIDIGHRQTGTSDT